jgi:hypothetical protein
MSTHAVALSTGVSTTIGVAAALLVGLLGALILVVLVVANRAEPDGRGLRPFSVYLFAMSFVALFTSYLGSIVVVLSVTPLVRPHQAPLTNAVARGCTVGGIITVLAALTLAYHLGRGRRLAWYDGRIDGPNYRILHTYVAGVSFVAIAIAVVALGVSAYHIFELVGPGVFAPGASRSGTVHSLINSGYVAVGALVIAGVHLRWGPRQLLPGFRRPPPSSPAAAPAGPVAPGPVPAPQGQAPQGQAPQPPSPYGQIPPSFQQAAPAPFAQPPGQAPPTQAPPTQPGPSQVPPSQAPPSQPGPSQPGPGQPGASQAPPNQGGPRHAAPNRPVPSQAPPIPPTPGQGAPGQPEAGRPSGRPEPPTGQVPPTGP